jgi:L-ascorbate metabolism protein UlaG (beta-lactamase superfamily)
MEIKFTWYGTANFILTLNGKNLLFDPFFYRNEKSFPELVTKKEDLADVDAIFISHGHFDHITEAGWLAEKLDIPVYCSETAKRNIINWSNGELLDIRPDPLSESTINKIQVCNYFEKISLTSNISVELFKSEHIRFDIPTILSRLFSWKFLKQARSMVHLGKTFQMGKVFGFNIQFYDKRIVSFGSLWHKYEDVLKKYQNCYILIAPLAGNSKRNIAKKAGKMIGLLKPKYVIPIHWDDFYPPISRLENLKPFFNLMKNKYPSIKVVMPIMDDQIIVEI